MLSDQLQPNSNIDDDIAAFLVGLWVIISILWPIYAIGLYIWHRRHKQHLQYQDPEANQESVSEQIQSSAKDQKKNTQAKQQRRKTDKIPQVNQTAHQETSTAHHSYTTSFSKVTTPESVLTYRDIEVGDVIIIEYADSNGEYTERTVDVKKVERLKFSGYCHLRHRYRTFRFDHVVNYEFG